jgi:hypothetical protein
MIQHKIKSRHKVVFTPDNTMKITVALLARRARKQNG